MRSPETIGEACARPGRGVCQSTFAPDLTFHSTGSCLLASTPLACGPRNWGQSVEPLDEAINVAAEARVVKKMRKGFIARHETGLNAIWQAEFDVRPDGITCRKSGGISTVRWRGL